MAKSTSYVVAFGISSLAFFVACSAPQGGGVQDGARNSTVTAPVNGTGTPSDTSANDAPAADAGDAVVPTLPDPTGGTTATGSEDDAEELDDDDTAAPVDAGVAPVTEPETDAAVDIEEPDDD